jgi:Mrp family chromosome partitioning ATPase
LLERAKRRAVEFAERYREHQVQLEQSAGGLHATAVAGLAQSPEALKAAREVIAKMVEQAKQEVSSLASKRDEADTLKALSAKMRQALAETEGRRSALALELELGDRFEVTSRGEVPLTPMRDTRIRFAAAGGLGAACLPMGAIGVLGLLRRKYRYVDEAATEVAWGRRLPLLGVLPVLPKRLKHGEREADAALCVHQVRVKLQGQDGERPVSYLISSASAQEGKTSLCMALGLSYAAAGAQTLLLDADMVGQGLTRGLGAQGFPGLRDALETGQVNIREHSKRLFVLTAGNGSAMDACKLSPTIVRRILAKEKERFDVVLIDSGPILGSVEAMVVAPMVDGVIVIVAQGQEPAMVERALRHLEAIGARLTGFVFNRARIKDFYKSFQSTLLKSCGPRGGATKPSQSGHHRLLGPIVDSVASFLPASTEKEP